LAPGLTSRKEDRSPSWLERQRTPDHRVPCNSNQWQTLQNAKKIAIYCSLRLEQGITSPPPPGPCRRPQCPLKALSGPIRREPRRQQLTQSGLRLSLAHPPPIVFDFGIIPLATNISALLFLAVTYTEAKIIEGAPSEADCPSRQPSVSSAVEVSRGGLEPPCRRAKRSIGDTGSRQNRKTTTAVSAFTRHRPTYLSCFSTLSRCLIRHYKGQSPRPNAGSIDCSPFE
jgi:hypothetical protein